MSRDPHPWGLPSPYGAGQSTEKVQGAGKCGPGGTAGCMGFSDWEGKVWRPDEGPQGLKASCRMKGTASSPPPPCGRQGPGLQLQWKRFRMAPNSLCPNGGWGWVLRPVPGPRSLFLELFFEKMGRKGGKGSSNQAGGPQAKQPKKPFPRQEGRELAASYVEAFMVHTGNLLSPACLFVQRIWTPGCSACSAQGVIK